MTAAPRSPRELAVAALPWACGIVGFVLAAKSIVGHTSDFAIYLETAREFRAGGFDIYRERATTGPWLYPHVVALPFVAMQALFDDRTCTWIWCLLLGLGTADILRSLTAITARAGALRWWQWAVFAFLFQRCLAQNMTHGQLSLFVGVAAARGVRALVEGRERRGGVWLGVAAVLKLTPLLFLVALPLMREKRAAVAMAITVVVAALALPWPFCGTAEHLRHLADFVRGIQAPLDAARQDRLLGNYAGPSIAGTFDYLLQPRPFDKDGHTVNLLAVGDGTLRVVKLAWSALLAATLAALFFGARRRPDGERLALQATAVMLAMAFFSPLVRVYHLAGALLPFALFCRGPVGRRDATWFATATAFAFAMTLRQRNLIGESAWRLFDAGGLLHFAMVAMLVWLVLQERAPTDR